LVNKKFLIVLDNLWEESFHFWEHLRIPLLSGKDGSKVLITTRNESTFRLMSPMLRLVNLTGLGKEHCWNLFSSFALPNGVEIQDELVQVGMEIANRCYGSPLAAKALGCALRGKGEEEWQIVLDELRVLEKDKNGTLPSLLISYHHLPYMVKKCFAYCCVFPNGYLFEKNQLIRYWLAEDLIQCEGGRRLEHVGTKYFDELMGGSFFESLLENNTIKGEKYRIPSLMHDLARLISDYEFVDLGNVGSKIRETGHFRYASLLHRYGEPLPIKDAYNFKNMRSLILCSEPEAPLTKVPSELFSILTRLRVLDLGNSELTELPEIADDQLIHLRYLGLSNTKIKNLPKSVCKLYNLQTLELRGCTNLVELPEGISKLVNLRHFGFHIDWENITDKHSLHMPHGINHLSYLQTLSRFSVASYSGGSCNICELKNIALRGDLCISNLENVTNHQDAKESNLGEKQYIERLMLRWSDEVSMDFNKLTQARGVAESLRPNNKLKCLWFVNYPDLVFPSWLGDLTFTYLGTVRVSNVEFVPYLGRLPWLKDLYIEKIKVTTMLSFVGYPSLEILTIREMPVLQKFIQQNDIPSIQKLEISGCHELREVVIHRNLHCGKYKAHNCTMLSQVICVPQD
jgi:Leucine-rich repeat (LRR) protein